MELIPFDTDEKSQGSVKANLVSPVFNSDKTSCIRIKLTSAQETRLQVSVFTSPDVFDTASAEFFEINVAGVEDQKFNIPLTASSKRAMFSCEAKKNDSLHLHSVMLLSDYQACSGECLV